MAADVRRITKKVEKSAEGCAELVQKSINAERQSIAENSTGDTKINEEVRALNTIVAVLERIDRIQRGKSLVYGLEES